MPCHLIIPKSAEYLEFTVALHNALRYNVQKGKTKGFSGLCPAHGGKCKTVTMQAKLPIGIENFEEIRTLGFYYVDKTRLIKDLLDNWSKVNLFTRPRRFSKSFNMNMLKYFSNTAVTKGCLMDWR